MLDGRSCVVPRMFSSSCQTENNWSYMKDYLLDLDIKNGKRPMEIDAEGEPQPRKCTKMLDSCQEVEIARVLFRQQSLQGKDSVVPQMDSEQDNQLDGDSMDSDVQQLLHAEIFLSASDQNQQQHQAGDSSDSGSLLPRMNRDSSIACLSRCSRSDYGSLASLNRSFQNIIRSGELYKWRRLNDIIEHWIYFSCALLEWEAYDPNRQRWMHLPRMASNGCFMFSDKESLAVGTELLVFGRELRSHVIYRYSLLTNSWSSGMRMNFPRCLFGSASLGEIAILAGGCDSEGHILDSAELYNSESQTWETLPNMIKPRKMCSGVFMDGKFYVIGGIGGSDSKLLTCGEEYNLQTRTWTEIPNMSPGRSTRGSEMPATAEAPPLVAVVNDELYAADYADMEVKKYNKDRKVWLTIGRLPERAVSMNGWGLAFRACGDRLIVIGGPRTHGEGFIELNSWVPSEGPPQWRLLARKRSGNFVYNCAVMGC
ncbi:F-box/kelch-repeat protein At1g26930-like [Lotus japonicus]|uniref:F-box/kelch-repeat protein At1g26930-like n=1 Tax=Lotus japonicus TaxID=34305 RepID=UPI002587CB1F|nr:F-box/kelch-repeat protein At1g26930-like [Lotus japonicus]XP_057448267.1 F-box/kelch-repeat protein At1g26930-like [Lotus japonicus]XP_057448268.1 F-box/kelch-repeat protein At1g26930-like [Lotus japonicus]XP_057448269.1 F-box/kelch-repeat protein At1g26930-like [Lotus japonicus]XP_057448270.1 F-box/kelch-repeat protein At1g26930-like [Lotus japonicus]